MVPYERSTDELKKIAALSRVPAELGLAFNKEAMLWLDRAGDFYFNTVRIDDWPTKKGASDLLGRVQKIAQKLVAAIEGLDDYCTETLNHAYWLDRFVNEKEPQPATEYDCLSGLVGDMKSLTGGLDYDLEYGVLSSVQPRPGPRRKRATKLFVNVLVTVWRTAGRNEKYSQVDSTYSGPFVEFVSDCFKALDIHYSNAAIGDWIKKAWRVHEKVKVHNQSKAP